jgi:hypothetical protein
MRVECRCCGWHGRQELFYRRRAIYPEYLGIEGRGAGTAPTIDNT